MKRLAALAAVAMLVAAPTALAITPGHTIHVNVPGMPGGSAVGEALPFKAYASIAPTVHLFGDVVTAKLAVVADTKWVDPTRLRVAANFTPYAPIRRPAVANLTTGRFEQITWTWRIRCIQSPCVPRVPSSDTSHVFHFAPVHISYLSLRGKRLYGENAYWPPVEVLSQVSPGVKNTLKYTKQIAWRYQLSPVGAATYRLSPTLVLWFAVVLAALFGAGALGLLGRWYLLVRPRRGAAVLPGTPLERAFAVLRYARETGDETLQRKAFERVAGELGVERADELSLLARELAWSPRTPEDEEVDRFAAQALGEDAS